MEKQKTALCLAIEQIKELQSNEEIGSFTKRAYAVCMDVLESLKPTEREIIENFTIHRIYFNPKELDTEEYFNEHLTQD